MLANYLTSASPPPEELQAVAAKLPSSWLYTLDGADHGFSVLKSSNRNRQDVWNEATDAFLGWLDDLG